MATTGTRLNFDGEISSHSRRRRQKHAQKYELDGLDRHHLVHGALGLGHLGDRCADRHVRRRPAFDFDGDVPMRATDEEHGHRRRFRFVIHVPEDWTNSRHHCWTTPSACFVSRLTRLRPPVEAGVGGTKVAGIKAAHFDE